MKYFCNKVLRNMCCSALLIQTAQTLFDLRARLPSGIDSFSSNEKWPLVVDLELNETRKKTTLSVLGLWLLAVDKRDGWGYSQ